MGEVPSAGKAQMTERVRAWKRLEAISDEEPSLTKVRVDYIGQGKGTIELS